MNRLLLLSFLCLFLVPVKAQVNTDADFKRQVYDREYTFGGIGHSRGYSINGRYFKYLDGYTKYGFEVEIAKLRHPKEVRTPSPFFSNSRGLVFGRINSLYTVRVGYAQEKILYDKTDQGSVSISLITNGGLSLGMLKPIYIQVFQGDGSSSNLSTERYNPLIHNQSIFGEANFFRGFGEIDVLPGIYGKVGANFDYDFLDDKITSMEVGIAYDYFFNEVPIFEEAVAEEDINWTGFFQIYLAINFGYKKN